MVAGFPDPRKAEKDRFMKNADTAILVSRALFMGSTLRQFNPHWRFSAPEYITESGDSFIELPDWLMGLLAERLGLSWSWGKKVHSHPQDRLQQFIESQDEVIARLKDDKSNLVSMMVRASEEESLSDGLVEHVESDHSQEEGDQSR